MAVELTCEQESCVYNEHGECGRDTVTIDDRMTCEDYEDDRG